VRIVWDPEKNETNVRKHGLDFNDACRVFDAPILSYPDDRQDYEEERWVGIGNLDDIVVTVVFSEPDEDVVRIISARKAVKHERIAFFESIAH